MQNYGRKRQKLSKRQDTQHSKQNNNCPCKEMVRVVFSVDGDLKRGNMSLVGCDLQLH